MVFLRKRLFVVPPFFDGYKFNTLKDALSTQIMHIFHDNHEYF